MRKASTSDRPPQTTWPKWHCPAHQLELVDEGAELHCPEGETFARVDGIPRFVESDSYAAAFGLQWKRYRRTQLDSYTGTTISHDRARRCLGDELWAELEGKHVLECGCGAGRFTEVLLRRGAYVTSVDLSTAVEANQDNFPQDEHHRVAQADIARLPFAPRQFDVVFCLGVVQHTPDPEKTVASLYEHVTPGGAIVFDHYTRRLRSAVGVAPLFRLYLRRLPPERGLRHTERLVDALLPLHRRGRRFARVLRRLTPVYSYYDLYPELSDELQREWALLDTHDGLTDWHKHFRTCPDMLSTMRSLGLEDLVCTEAGNGIEVRGRRPPGDPS